MRWRLSLALILSGTAGVAEPLTFVRSVVLGSDLPEFGGLSAIEMPLSGSEALMLSDRGAAFALSIDRAAGTYAITSVPQPRPHRDSEGLAWDGTAMFFSYEGPGAVVRADGKRLAVHPDFSTHRPNGSLEALAAAPDGTLYTLPERSGDPNIPFPIYRYTGGTWEKWAALPRLGPFLPAGADIGPDGMLYILERAFSPLGFRSRIRRLDPKAPEVETETVLKTRAGLHDNLEGLALWRSDSGATCLSMVSDNNFLSVQRTELVEYALTETLAGGATCD
ncbi:esterase-like activity of phytase family protein [uncultured Tateyamaria sp.]|uniref:esterase-like activity of phytase family protein n=1 Tax=Tateyamaria sp. TaxID=1929288 RepID=UPI00261A2FAA|nr:esterase-like activity of phytase family protein [uncultured Tateyamaria sp.]